MKDTEFKTLIEGKDLSKAEDQKVIFDAINNSENSLMARKETAFNEKYSKLENEFNTFKTTAGNESKAAKETATKLEEAVKENQLWKNKAWVYKNVDSAIDDDGFNDFNALVQNRMRYNNKLSYEDAAKEVGQKYFGKKDVQAQKLDPIPTPGVRFTGGNTASESVELDNSTKSQQARFKSLMGHGRN